MAAARAPKPLLSAASSLRRGRHAIGSFSCNERRVGCGYSPARPSCHRRICSAHHVHRGQWAPPTHSILAAAFCNARPYSPEAGPPQSLSDLEFRVRALERSSKPKRLTDQDVQHQIWPLLVECAAPPSLAAPSGTGFRRNSLAVQQELLERAKLGSRLLDLCLKGVEARRVFLWEWQQSEETGNDPSDFSPTAYWNEAPHPPKEMHALILSAWRGVIESCSSFSVKSVDAMELMERSAQQASALLVLMEDERHSDAAFVDSYNAQVDKGRYTSIVSGAAIPDVRNYGEVLATWGQCIDGSALRLPDKHGRGKYPTNLRDGSFQRRLQLEATAMKSMMKLLESMEECLYETFGSKPERMRPPPDRVCYNVILASMARQVNPSLYEMRLVLQRMMERVKFELEHSDEDDNPDLEGPEDEQYDERAMAFFPDVYSYNALIEARANRSVMFSSDSGNERAPELSPPRRQHQAAWQQGTQNHSQRRKKFSSSEEEALLAEQILDEMGHLITANVMPNIWSYNALIKAWIKADSERGLQRAVMILHSLALNLYRREEGHEGEAGEGANNNTTAVVPSVFGRIVRWGASLLGKETGGGAKHPKKSLAATKPRSNNARAGGHVRAPKGAVSFQPEVRGLNESEQHQNGQQNQQTMAPISFGMGTRMAMMSSVMQAGGPPELSSSGATVPEIDESKVGQHGSSEPIGPLPGIEPNVTPDLKTFVLVINALERKGTAASAKVAEGLLQLLEEHYWELNPDIAIYNSALNAWAKAAKTTPDVPSCLASAQKADRLLNRLLTRGEPGMFPQPTEYSFLMAINAWANAASASMSAKNVSDGKKAAERAEDLLGSLERQPLTISKATLACYGAVIRMWGPLGEPERAQAVLERMIAISGNLPQDLIHFNTVLDAWAQDLALANDPEKIASRLSSLRDFLANMNRDESTGSFNVEADTSSFNHVIRACYAPWASAKTDGDEGIRQQALEIALDTYSKTREGGYDNPHRPDAHTYTHLFKALACLLPADKGTDPETRTKQYRDCQAIFRDCCNDGHLAKSSVWIVRKMLASEDEFADLILSQMGDRGGGLSKERLLGVPEERLYACLPEEWSREGRRLRRCTSTSHHNRRGLPQPPTNPDRQPCAASSPSSPPPSRPPAPDLRKELIKCSSELRHRGPDWSGYVVVEKDPAAHRPLNHGIAHERLAIMDPESGSQPLVSRDGNVIVAANGEVYNYKELFANLTSSYTPATGSDCEVILPLWGEHGPSPDLPNKLRGMFSVIVYDKSTDAYFIFRDHIGKTPLYIGWGNDGSVYVGSEMKSLVGECAKFQNFPPGHCYSNKGPRAGEFVRWYTPNWAPEMKPGLAPPTDKFQPDVLRHAFEKAVTRRMMSDVPWGVLLSGGLDSSLVASICARNVARRSSSFPKLHSFTIGLAGSPDLVAAKRVADFLGTIHHAYTYTLEEGADAIREVIRSIETYDVTTIRASTPMYLMSRKIKAMGIKMVLSGEGADEVFGGYLYFHKAPNTQEFYDETVDKISRLHMYDCLRCNKAMSAWGVEPRCPFLDADFLQVAMNIDPKEKMIVKGPGIGKADTRIEKYVVRKAFDTPDDPYLPEDILWRQKEQFSDGVGYGWVDSLKDIAEREVTDQMFANAANRYPYNTPTTKEGYRYRMIFEELFPGEAAEKTVPGGKSIACSTERAMNWDASFALRADPSGRAAGTHDSAYGNEFVADTVVDNGEPPAKKAKS